jgi:hypothetical protein
MYGDINVYELEQCVTHRSNVLLRIFKFYLLFLAAHHIIFANIVQK